MARLSRCKNDMDGKGSKKSAIENSKITWFGEARICNKQLKHFPSFCTGGINIAANSFVFVLGEEGCEHLAYVKDLYEDQNNLKMVRVIWFYFPKDIEYLTTDMEIRDKEIFISRYEQDIFAECINGLATVMTPDHFDKCLKYLPEFISSETFLCHKEFRNKTIKHFRFHRLPGYSSQPVVFRLIKHLQKLPEGEGSEKPNLVQEPQKCETFNVNDNVEILSQDSSLRGCWYRCKVLRVIENYLKVQYYDVLYIDGPKKLEQWVPSHRVANPDVLGMRHAGRLMIRPMPSEDESASTKLDTGSAVDAWWDDGWWEGVLLGNEAGSVNNLQLFFPGEKMFQTIERKNVRASRDWIDEKWKNIIPNPNILSSINSIINTTPPPNVTGTSPNVTGISRNTHNMKRDQGPNDLSEISSKTVKRKANLVRDV